MDDLIRRQDAIDAFNNEIIKRRLLDDMNDGMLDEFDTESILRELPSVEPEQRWIPCSERLPEDGLYIVTTSKGQVQVHVFNHSGNSEEYWMRCNKAWIPLPEPWKGEEDE